MNWSIEIILNILLGIGLFFYWMTVFVILYHLTRFGIGVQPKRFAAIFLFGSVLLFCISIVSYTQLDLEPLINAL